MLHRTSLKDGIDRFLNETPDFKPNKLEITNSLTEHFLSKDIGEPPAFLVTSGFEWWPHQRQPAQRTPGRASLHRSKPLVKHDLIFGVSERITSEGHVIQSLDLAELEFLAAKLELTETKTVALGFMHASKNPAHEIQAKEFLTSKGFKVYASHEFSLKSDLNSPLEVANNEVARWWRTFVCAYLEPAYTGYFEDLIKYGQEKGIALDFQVQGEPKNWVDCWFQRESRFDIKEPVLLLDFQRFAVLTPTEEKCHIVQSKWGPVLINNSLRIENTPLQPLQEVGLGRMNTLDVILGDIKPDLGNMLLGRSLRPTLFDIACLNSDTLCAWNKNHTSSDNLSKLESLMSTIARNVGLSQKEIVKSWMNLWLDTILGYLQRKQLSTIATTGDFAEVLNPLLAQRAKELQLRQEFKSL